MDTRDLADRSRGPSSGERQTYRDRSTASLTFYGAAGTVTGSRFLVETDRTRLLVDAGLFQGARSLRRRNWEPPFVDPSSLDAVIVSHAHLDHSGYLPVLARHGFSGPIWCSPGTSQLVPIVLSDAVFLQEREAEQSRRGRYSKHTPPKPLFDQRDAETARRLIPGRSLRGPPPGQ